MTQLRPLALISGGTSGIGAGIAGALAADFDLALGFKENHKVAGELLQGLCQKFPSAECRTYQAPLSELHDVEDWFQKVVADFGRPPSVIVHCAGRLHDGLFVTANFAEQSALVQQHLVVGMALAKVALPAMYKQKFGRVVFMSSLSAHVHRRGQAAYAAAKSGLESFSKTLALEVAHNGVTVNCVAPGLIESAMTGSIVRKLRQSQERIRDKIPVGFVGQPADVAALVKFLCSQDSRYITGTVIPVDGGQSIGDPLS